MKTEWKPYMAESAAVATCSSTEMLLQVTTVLGGSIGMLSIAMVTPH